MAICSSSAPVILATRNLSSFRGLIRITQFSTLTIASFALIAGTGSTLSALGAAKNTDQHLTIWS